MKKVLDRKTVIPVELRIRSFKIMVKTRDVEIQTELLKHNITIEYLPYGSDMPYRIVVGNDPVNFVDSLGLDETKWFGHGRNPFTMGPRNGNWGGVNYSGGQNPLMHEGKSGTKPPLDSGDYCYLLHDTCYDIGRKSVKQCDKELVDRLRELDDNPEKWLLPPRKGTERDSRRFRKWAIWWFDR